VRCAVAMAEVAAQVNDSKSAIREMRDMMDMALSSKA